MNIRYKFSGSDISFDSLNYWHYFPWDVPRKIVSTVQCSACDPHLMFFEFASCFT